MIGYRTGKLEVIKYHGNDKHQKKQWLCKCECGNECIAVSSVLKHKTRPKQHCGCETKTNKQKRWKEFRKDKSYFWDKVNKTDTCWLWEGAKDSLGYGNSCSGIEHGRRVHRASWEFSNGPIPEGMHVLHKCDVRNCVNPDHLFLGSHSDNMKDMAAKGRRKNINTGVKNGRAKLNMDDVNAIRNLYNTGKMSQIEISVIFGISQVSVSKIVRGLSY